MIEMLGAIEHVVEAVAVKRQSRAASAGRDSTAKRSSLLLKLLNPLGPFSSPGASSRGAPTSPILRGARNPPALSAAPDLTPPATFSTSLSRWPLPWGCPLGSDPRWL